MLACDLIMLHVNIWLCCKNITWTKFHVYIIMLHVDIIYLHVAIWHTDATHGLGFCGLVKTTIPSKAGKTCIKWYMYNALRHVQSFEIRCIIRNFEFYSILASWVSDSVTTDVLFFNSLITLHYPNPVSS